MPERAKIEPVVRLPDGSFFDLREIAAVYKPDEKQAFTQVVMKGGTTFYLKGEDGEFLQEMMGAYHFGIALKKERN